MSLSLYDSLPFVKAPLAYLAHTEAPIEHRIYPAASGIRTVRPPLDRQIVPIHNARAIADTLTLDANGFAFKHAPSPFSDFYDDVQVKARYYPEVAAYLQRALEAHDVIVFDHNTRSAIRAARGDPGVRLPVDAVHNDYTELSGPRRAAEIVAEASKPALGTRRFAFVNLWRPIIGPVQDTPLAVCDARSVRPEEIVDTPIFHYGDDDLQTPNHSGYIQSVRYHPDHRWAYIADMQPNEVLLLKCFDSMRDGRARFMPHTGFKNPACPEQFTPRESIEARTLVVF